MNKKIFTLQFQSQFQALRYIHFFLIYQSLGSTFTQKQLLILKTACTTLVVLVLLDLFCWPYPQNLSDRGTS